MDHRKQNRPEVIEAVVEIINQYLHRPGFRRIIRLISTNSRSIDRINGPLVLYEFTVLILPSDYCCAVYKIQKIYDGIQDYWVKKFEFTPLTSVR